MARAAVVGVGPSVHFIFYEDGTTELTDEREAMQAGRGASASGGEGLHVCIYIAHFKRAYETLVQTCTLPYM